MPGLLRGVARVAVASGTATAVSNRVSRRQANKWADQGDTYYPQSRMAPPPQQQQQMQPPPPAPLRSLSRARSTSSRIWPS